MLGRIRYATIVIVGLFAFFAWTPSYARDNRVPCVDFLVAPLQGGAPTEVVASEADLSAEVSIAGSYAVYHDVVPMYCKIEARWDLSDFGANVDDVFLHTRLRVEEKGDFGVRVLTHQDVYFPVGRLNFEKKILFGDFAVNTPDADFWWTTVSGKKYPSQRVYDYGYTLAFAQGLLAKEADVVTENPWVPVVIGILDGSAGQVSNEWKTCQDFHDESILFVSLLDYDTFVSETLYAGLSTFLHELLHFWLSYKGNGIFIEASGLFGDMLPEDKPSPEESWVTLFEFLATKQVLIGDSTMSALLGLSVFTGISRTDLEKEISDARDALLQAYALDWEVGYLDSSYIFFPAMEEYVDWSLLKAKLLKDSLTDCAYAQQLTTSVIFQRMDLEPKTYSDLVFEQVEACVLKNYTREAGTYFQQNCNEFEVSNGSIVDLPHFYSCILVPEEDTQNFIVSVSLTSGDGVILSRDQAGNLVRSTALALNSVSLVDNYHTACTIGYGIVNNQGPWFEVVYTDKGSLTLRVYLPVIE